jgi:hypothetical protein
VSAKDYVEAAKVSCTARTRWNKMNLGRNPMRILAAIDMFLAGHGKVADTISNDQLMAAAGFVWNSQLDDARKVIIEHGCIGFTPSVGGRRRSGIGYAPAYFYLPGDFRDVALDLPPGESPGTP